MDFEKAVQLLRLRDYDPKSRAEQISRFLGHPLPEVEFRLAAGFHANHAKVAEDFRAANPQSHAELLEWYRVTDAYIYELTAYHLEPGFNYIGMVCGIGNHLLANSKPKVLCVGDGVGDLTIACHHFGLRPTYHDLAGSKTAAFAVERIAASVGAVGWNDHLTKSWEPPKGKEYDAAVSLDYLEHVPNVEEWTRAIYDSLKPGGLFLAQNAFGIGSPDREGSIPMHLSSNTHWEKDWEPLMKSLGFQQEPGWWRKPCAS